MSAYPRFYMSAGADACDDFIEKPFDLDDMAGRIKKLTRRSNRSLYAI
jgi:DNA-binding response OmpR family regulator